MKVGQAFPGKYLKAASLPVDGRGVPVEMDYIEMETMPQDEEEKPVLYFKGKDQGLVLNVTNANMIAELHEDEMDNWPGKLISLYGAKCDMKGKRVACIRVKDEVPAADAPGDDIPF